MKIYNTLTKKKEEFNSIDEHEVKMYVCGPTVYDYAHLGHGRTYVVFDTIRRYLEHKNYIVKLVINFTDIDDKIIKRANEENIPPTELADKFIKSFLEDMEKLNIKPAYVYPRVSEHIKDIIRFIEVLIKKGYAYVADDGIYFDVRKFKDYGKLSNINLDEIRTGYRIETNLTKRNPEDFALWKFAKPNEPKWDSPWGEGRPAWHIECSAMGIKYLGEQFDIHGGGNDLIFPHHENEIAQSEVYTDKKPWVKYWIHTGFVMMDKEKMSKSLGNFVELKDLLDKYDFEVIRLFLLQRHYRSPLDYSEEGLLDAKISLEKLYNTLKNIDAICRNSHVKHKLNEIDIKTYETIKNAWINFYNAMDDDFNTPEALKYVFEVSSVINKYMNESNNPNKSLLIMTNEFFKMIGEIFGIFHNIINNKNNEDKNMEGHLIDILINIRAKLKEEKNYKLADEIRSELKNIGIQLEDSPKGTIWKKL
ncbi:cysteine--tRNA ligase [Methanothermococcus okinawensis]|uniref:Cysteine--tRNA ligase n=1 Tax=Methanothermococcus okinawensis (strain DSM 14208 / JCM 11175 / IH1) TaxID=647113 RepID=F8ALS6_METOI|nr:cysteine--tRNA ligase [Methanothermococcus okinawensis]AEH06635.1 cysteinyl-tRNA synthetase [Methanothermococcus okinawensis IH1]